MPEKMSLEQEIPKMVEQYTQPEAKPTNLSLEEMIAQAEKKAQVEVTLPQIQRKISEALGVTEHEAQVWQNERERIGNLQKRIGKLPKELQTEQILAGLRAEETVYRAKEKALAIVQGGKEITENNPLKQYEEWASLVAYGQQRISKKAQKEQEEFMDKADRAKEQAQQERQQEAGKIIVTANLLENFAHLTSQKIQEMEDKGALGLSFDQLLERSVKQGFLIKLSDEKITNHQENRKKISELAKKIQQASPGEQAKIRSELSFLYRQNNRVIERGGNYFRVKTREVFDKKQKRTITIPTDELAQKVFANLKQAERHCREASREYQKSRKEEERKLREILNRGGIGFWDQRGNLVGAIILKEKTAHKGTRGWVVVEAIGETGEFVVSRDKFYLFGKEPLALKEAIEKTRQFQDQQAERRGKKEITEEDIDSMIRALQKEGFVEEGGEEVTAAPDKGEIAVTSPTS